MNAVLFSLLTFVSTAAGGAVAVRVRDRLHLLLGFSAGAVLGVVFFEVLPELIKRTRIESVPLSTAMLVVVAGFLSFFFLERLTALHGGRDHEHQAHREHGVELGVVGAAGLSVHSFLDGVAIGAGFKTSGALGVLIGIGVLAHDFSDGLNTVTVVLAHGNSKQRAIRWLLIDAAAPVLGALSVVLIAVPRHTLLYLLAFFVGFFLYIGSSDLLPEAREHESPWVAAAAVGGLALVYGVTRLAL
jgi:zinc transporter ZupT